MKITTRIAPSPTGSLHIGTLGMALCNQMLARQSGGNFYLRIEDTDQKREVEGEREKYIQQFANCGISFDAIYIQSERTEYYQKQAQKLISEGKAYKCYCTEQELEEIRKNHRGYNNKCRNAGEQNKRYVIRANFSQFTEPVKWLDLVKGDMQLPAETIDPVIMKSNGIPPYNLAHVVDDTLMNITHVLRGEEWLVSTAQHIQLFELCGFKPPNYLHMPVICVEENGKKRKLSKRKDSHALVENLINDGYPLDALKEYLLTLYNGDFELWRIANPDKPHTEFKFTTEKIGSNNPLFDWDKLNNISKNIIAKMPESELQQHIKDRRVIKLMKGRKDIYKFSQVPETYSYLYNNEGIPNDNARKYAEIYNHSDEKDVWWAKLKNSGIHPMDIRRAVTGREQTPDLYTILQLLGEQEVLKRLKKS